MQSFTENKKQEVFVLMINNVKLQKYSMRDEVGQINNYVVLY